MIVYNSTDGSAPVLTNANGSLINLFDKCLVTGYGAKAAAGWTKPYTGTTLAVFKQGTGGNNRYMRVFDGGLQADASNRRVNVRGYEAMTAVSTGTNPFPTTTQVTGNGMNYPYINLSAGSAPIWTLYATPSFFILLVDVYPTNTYYEMMAFGTFFSDKSGDTFNDVIIANPSSTGNGGWGGQRTEGNGIFVTRNDQGTVGAKDSALRSTYDYSGGGYVGQGNSAFIYPNRVQASLLQSQPVIWSDGYPRGRIPGLWETLHTPASVGGMGTTWSGAGSLAGKAFKLFGALSPAYIGGAWPVIETSDTWS